LSLIRSRALGALWTLGLFAGLAAPCSADPGDLHPSLEILQPLGDVYNERTSDGDAFPEGRGIRGYLGAHPFSVWIDYHRNVYETQNDGPNTLTEYPRIEGGFGTSVPFLARESTFEARFEHLIGNSPYYAGIGVEQTWTNYHYPSLRGAGVALERRASSVPGIRPFGSIAYYPAMLGSYVTETVPHQSLQLSYRILKLDYGFMVRVRRSPVYFVADYGNEFRRGNGLPAQIRFIRSDTSLGFGTRL
jgi:hypothetical protein